MKQKTVKRLIVFMGILSMFSGLLGCSEEKINVDEFGPGDYDNNSEVGDDFSMDGPGEYKKIAEICLSVSGYGPNYTYDIHVDEEDESRTVLYYENFEESNDEMEMDVDDETLEQVSKLCQELNIYSWDKFNKKALGVLDGSGFSLSVHYEDGTNIMAHGSNSFPKNYYEFEKGFIEILTPIIDARRDEIKQELYESGAYSQVLESAMVNYKDRGESGSDSYSFLITCSNETTKADIQITSNSGDFIEEGEYKYYGNPDDTAEVLAKVQEVVEKYKVYKWDGYDESTPDYNDREWFQLAFYYPETRIDCMGCGDTENYEEVRKELLTVLCDYAKKHAEPQ